jgi:hypothetical protein
MPGSIELPVEVREAVPKALAMLRQAREMLGLQEHLQRNIGPILSVKPTISALY